MSDLLIKGMEMPEGCVECPLLLAYGSRLENKIIHHCMGRLPEDSRFSDDADLTKRPKEGCPLVEVKTHGRLIDADELEVILDEVNGYGGASEITYKKMIEILHDETLSPTIVEASE